MHFSIPAVFACVKESLQTATACKKCLASLACCVTDSCSFCECRSTPTTRSLKDPKDNLVALKRSRHWENFLFQLREPAPVHRPHLVSDPYRAALALPTPGWRLWSRDPFVCVVCVHCRCPRHPSPCCIPPVPLCLHGHPGVQGLWWEEGLQVGRLPAKVPHYFCEAVSKDLFQHVLALPWLPAWWKMGPDARPWRWR